MLKRTRSALQELSSYYGLLPLLGSATVVGGVSAWAAYVLAALKPYAPLSWIMAGLLGALIIAVVLVCLARARDYFLMAGIKRRFYELPDKTNPMQKVYENIRINVKDLMPPVGVSIVEKTFVGCEIVGPFNVLFNGSKVDGCSFTQSDGIIVNGNGMISNAVEFRSCNFSKCHFFFVSFLVPVRQIDIFEKGFSGIPWISDPRI